MTGAPNGTRHNAAVRTAIHRNPSALFFASATALVLACAAIVRSHLFVAAPDLGAFGVTFDLTITLPLLYWFLVVRTGRSRPLTIAPVFIVGTLIAAALVPRNQQQFLAQLQLIVIPAELLLVAALVQRVRRMERSTSADPYERISVAMRSVAGDGRVAEIVASELTVTYYALFAWKQRPAETDDHAFTVHERSGWGTVLAGIFVLIVAESIGMHLLLALWSPVAAWTWTFFDVWAMVWLLGDYHALRLRRSTIDGEALHLRHGLRWSVSIPLTSIASIEEVRNWQKRRDVLKVAMLDEPRWLIELHEPVVARGLAGLRKEIRGIALLPDDEETISVLRSAIDRHPGCTHAARR
jgi:hypothetical protein